MPVKTPPSRDLLLRVLDYDAETGQFHWKVRVGARGLAGNRAGSIDSNGHRQIKVDGRLHLAHRLAWLYTHDVWPNGPIDHRNGDRDDNRLVNLREATHSQNVANSHARSTNTSGVSCVSWYPRYQKWVVRVTKEGRRICVGYFKSFADAVQARHRAAREAHGEFFNPGVRRP